MMLASKSLADIVGLMERQGADGIELGPTLTLSVESFRNLWRKLNPGPRFLVHNYFPLPAEEFVLNLASTDPEILDKSLEHCRGAIDLCVEIGSPFYSVHAGFAFHAYPGDLGRNITHCDRWPLEHAEALFEESLCTLCEYAQEKGIRILIENNVLEPFNLINGRNEMLLGVTAQELLNIIAAVDMPNLGLLIDMGHLKVSARSLDFSTSSFLNEVAPYVEAFHLSDNDGDKDDNQPFGEDAWFMGPLRDFPAATLVIEVCESGESEVRRMISSLRRGKLRRT